MLNGGEDIKISDILINAMKPTIFRDKTSAWKLGYGVIKVTRNFAMSKGVSKKISQGGIF